MTTIAFVMMRAHPLQWPLLRSAPNYKDEWIQERIQRVTTALKDLILALNRKHHVIPPDVVHVHSANPRATPRRPFHPNDHTVQVPIDLTPRAGSCPAVFFAVSTMSMIPTTSAYRYGPFPLILQPAQPPSLRPSLHRRSK